MRWRGVPVLSLLLGAMTLLMLPPAGMAALAGQWRAAQAFSDGALIGALCATGLAALSSGKARRVLRGREELLTVVFAFALVPVVAAAPFYLYAPWIGPDGAYFEAVSLMTTTGATVLADPEFLPDSVHLWRALLAWLGGLTTLLTAFAILAPRNLGGFEVAIVARQGQVGRLAADPPWAGGAPRDDSDARLTRAAKAVAPVYAALTALAACVFAATGVPALTSFVQAAGVMSTCALRMGAQTFVGGWLTEAAAILFLCAAATRRLYWGGSLRRRARLLRGDPEVELAMIAVFCATGWITIAHLAGGATPVAQAGWGAAVSAIWGEFFTSVSFLTTTGYVSEHWAGARAWSDASGAGFLMVGLAAMGGGVASTAGGVKLLRSYALYRQSVREISRLSQPSALLPDGAAGRRVGAAGAEFAFVFVVLFLMGVALVSLILAGLGMDLDVALVAALATLSNAGAGLDVALGSAAPSYETLGAAERLSLCAAMVLGRVEIFAVIALANPAYWRR